MRAAGRRGCHGQRRRVRTTVPDRQATPAPDRVERAFAPPVIGGPNRLWAADISSVATQEGWLFLAIVLDAFSRRVVGWAMADHLRTELVLDALAMAIRARRPAPGLIHHSDHGCQYTSLAFGQRLQAAGILPSRGTIGDCFDKDLPAYCTSKTSVRLKLGLRWLVLPFDREGVAGWLVEALPLVIGAHGPQVATPPPGLDRLRRDPEPHCHRPLGEPAPRLQPLPVTGQSVAAA
jgi:transposase InsO family protein